MEPVSTAIAVAGVASGIAGGLSARSKAKDAARHQARLTYQQRMEEIRRQKKQNEFDYGMGVAAVGASNLQFSGSSRAYLRAMKMEQMRQVAWAEQAARQERRAIRKGAAGAGDALFAQAAMDIAQLGANLYENRAPTTGWGDTPGTVNDSFLNTAESQGAFDETF